jgi:hypothetical protein
LISAEQKRSAKAGDSRKESPAFLFQHNSTAKTRVLLALHGIFAYTSVSGHFQSTMPQKNNPPPTPPRELAKQLLDRLQAGRVASTFLESYAQQFDRPEATAHPERRRELETMLDREMLLAMTAHIARVTELNARARRSSRTRRDDPAIFLRDLVAALTKESNWTAGDAMEFRGDLEIYRRLAAIVAARASSTRSRIVVAGPFVDRCAILLDPSMIENASRAAGKLLLRLEAESEILLSEVLNQPSTKKKSC